MNKHNDMRMRAEAVAYPEDRPRDPPHAYRRRLDQHLVSLTAPDSYEAEQYRKLRYVIEILHQGGEGVVVGICSPAAGDGKSMTAVNLAGALAQDASVRVLLIDADLRRLSDTLKDRLDLGKRTDPGLTDAIHRRDMVLQDVVRHLLPINLAVIPVGSASPAPYETLRSPRLGELIAEARRRYDYVIVDAPPVVPVSDCQLLAKWMDAFVMVVTAHYTPRPMLEEALELMEPKKLLGLIFNRSDQRPSRYYGYGYYGYGGRPAAELADEELVQSRAPSRLPWLQRQLRAWQSTWQRQR